MLIPRARRSQDRFLRKLSAQAGSEKLSELGELREKTVKLEKDLAELKELLKQSLPAKPAPEDAQAKV
jgi:hypothetical protein